MPVANLSAQNAVVPLLQRSLERGRLGHAYLFTGVDLGELVRAGRSLAQLLNCLEPPQATAEGVPLAACGGCVSCRKIEQDKHPDVMLVRPESLLRQIRIRQIVRRQDSPARVLHDLVNHKATEGRYKVALLEAADRLNTDAANSLLKSLEEPPARTIFILLSTEPERLLDTIRSRCPRMSLGGDGQRKFGEPEIDWLTAFATMAAAEKKDLFGRYRLLGSLMERLSEVKTAIAEDFDKAAEENEHEEIPPEQRERNEDERKAAVEAEYRFRRAGYLAALQGWLRDVWLRSVDISDELALFPDLAAPAQSVAARLAPREALENLRVMERTQSLLHTNVNELLALETGLLKLKL
jgi:hypothetical protein